MFAAARDAFRAKRFVERTGEMDHLIDGFAVAAAAERIVRLVVEGDIEHGTEIEIKTEKPKQPPGDLAVSPNECNLALVAELLRVRRFVTNQAQTGDPPPFLIDRDERLDLTQVSQVIDQLPQLRRAGDVAAEKNEAARLHAPIERGCFRIELSARHAGEKKLDALNAGHEGTNLGPGYDRASTCLAGARTRLVI